MLEDERGRVVGIEVKRTSSPGSNHFRGLRALRDAAGHRFVRGILLYGGTESVGFEKDLHALPLSALWQA